jgi:hypothetical protein
LLEKLRRSRESNVEAGGFTFTIRRPTAYQLGQITDRSEVEVNDDASGQVKTIQVPKDEPMLRRFVVGWNVKEIDIIPGGDATPAAFDADLLIEWLQEQPAIWQVLIAEIWQLYTRRDSEVADGLGKPVDGLSKAD